MGTPNHPRSSLRRNLVRGCAAVGVGLGAAALVGWATGNPALLGLRDRYIPMAPNTAIAFLALGGGLLILEGGRRGGAGGSSRAPAWRRRLAATMAAFITVLGALRVCEFVLPVDFGVDRWFLSVPAETFGLAPVGKMAFSTAGAFLAAGVALLLLALPSPGGMSGHLAGVGAMASGATGLVFALGYLYSPNAPLQYGTGSIPMALNTAIAFVALGAGLAASAGPGAFPLARLEGPSIRARLLRVFLPLVVVTICAVAWLTHLVSRNAGDAYSALSSAALATAAIALFGAICGRVASHAGEQLEQAEAALRRARDELEQKVQERTAELRRAFDDLSTGHEALRLAHHELQQAQSRMLEQAKMASLGQTAAGVAHEINNPLAFVSNNMFVLRREVASLHDILCLYQKAERSPDGDRDEVLAEIHTLCEQVDLPYVLDNLDRLLDRSYAGLKRIQKIVEDLRDFARIDEADFQDADLNAGIVATLNIMRNLADSRGVALESDLRPLPRVTCYPAKVNLVVQNLVSNAIDACSPGGAVSVSTRADGDGIEITVADTGPGIDPAIRDRVFDPFFTTKPIGQGTGLGLSMSYGIVRDHGGTIDFESIPGIGTRFAVRLPLVAARVPTAGLASRS